MILFFCLSNYLNYALLSVKMPHMHCASKKFIIQFYGISFHLWMQNYIVIEWGLFIASSNQVSYFSIIGVLK